MRWRTQILLPAALAALTASTARAADPPLPLAGTHASAAPYRSGFVVASVSQAGVLQVAQLSPPTGSGDWVWGEPATIGTGFDRAAPYVFVRNGVEIYVFVMSKWSDMSNLVACYRKYPNGEAVSPGDTYTQQIVRYGAALGTGGFGTAPIPDGSGMVFVMTDLTLQTATVCHSVWTSDGGAPLLTLAKTIPLPTDLPPGYDGNIAAAVTLNFDRMASWYPYRLTLALHPASGSGDHIRTREYRLNTFITEPNRDRYILTAVPGDDRWNALSAVDVGNGLAMHEGVDGRVYIAGTTPTGPTLFARTGFDSTTQAANWVTAAALNPAVYGYSGDVPGFAYFPAFNGMDIFPIRRLAFINDAPTGKVIAHVEEFGKGRRRGIPQTPRSAAGLVIGIVDGPPPFDNKNLNLDPAWDTGASNTAETNFGVTSTSTATVAGSMEAGLSLGFSASTGFGFAGLDFGVEASVELEASFGASYSSERTNTSEQAVRVALEKEGAAGAERVRPRGTLVMAKMGFVGRAFEFLDTSDHPIPGARLYNQIWPTGVDFTVVQYWMNPNGRRPGDLQSYLATPEALDDLASLSKIKFAESPGGSTADFLVFSWAGGSSVSQTWKSFDANQLVDSAAFSVKSALKVSASAPMAGEVSATLGSSLAVSREWGTGSTYEVGVSTVEDVRNNINAPDSYTGTTYRTYLLRDSNDYIRELLSDDPNGIGLVTTTWPVDPTMRRQNEDVKAQIIRTSTPWKITYLVTDAPYNPPSGIRPADPILEPAIRVKLDRFGIRTPGAMRLLLDLVAAQGKPAPRGYTVEPWRLARERRAQAQRLNERITAQSNGALIRAAMRVVTPAECSAIGRYIDAVNAAERERWLRANPNRYPLFTPARVRSAPDFVVPKPDFTRIPPAELPPR